MTVAHWPVLPHLQVRGFLIRCPLSTVAQLVTPIRGTVRIRGAVLIRDAVCCATGDACVGQNSVSVIVEALADKSRGLRIKGLIELKGCVEGSHCVSPS